MERKITYENIAEAVSRLKDQSISVNSHTVRNYLKAGSYETIQKLLDEYRQKQGHPFPEGAPAYSEELRTMFNQIADKMWDESLKLVNHKYESAKQSLMTLSEGFKRDAEKNARQLDEIERQLAQSREELAAQDQRHRERIENLVGDLNKARGQLEILQQENDNKKEQIDRLQAALGKGAKATEQA